MTTIVTKPLILIQFFLRIIKISPANATLNEIYR